MKLQGLKVLDLSSFLPGPYLTLALADHGAEVLKIEAPGGDHGRDIGLADGEHTVFFRNLNRGKKSVVLDLKDPAQLERLLTLCDEADVFIESFRPGVAERLGIGADIVRTRNPRIVYCSISAFGQTGDLRSRPAHDLAVEGMAGLLSMTLGQDGKPAIPGVPLSDLLAGLQGLAGVLMALLRREQTGRGDRLDISMLDATVAGLPNIVGPVFAEHRQPVPQHERTTGGSAFYRLYVTRDGGHIALAGQEAKFVHTLLEHFGRPELAELVLRGPGAHQAPVVAFLERRFAQRDRIDWEQELSGLDVCFGPVRSLVETFDDAQLAARGLVLHDEAGRKHIGSTIRFSDEPARLTNLRAPLLDEHAAEIFGARSSTELARTS